MEINKQLFEDILSGKLRGTFVLKNGKKFNDRFLTNIYNCTVVLCKTTYYFNGKPIVSAYNGVLDIVDFIPDTYMETKELKIQIPEGYCIDESQSTFEKIVFKKKDIKPRSWEEYCKNLRGQFYYIQDDRDNIGTSFTTKGLISAYKNILPSKELVEAFLAMMQLMSLRQAWIEDWKPNYYMNTASNWGIEYEPNPGRFSIENHCRTNGGGLTFPTKEIATDFMNCFEDLLNIARPLI